LIQNRDANIEIVRRYQNSTTWKKIAYGGYEQTRQTKDEVGIMYLFPLLKGPEGLAFVYKTPTAIMEMPLEYELKDLDLP
jgi:hypothetical protein